MKQFEKAIRELRFARQTIEDIEINGLKKKIAIDNSKNNDYLPAISADTKAGEYGERLDKEIVWLVKKTNLFILTRDNEVNCLPFEDCQSEHGTCDNYKPFRKDKCLVGKIRACENCGKDFATKSNDDKCPNCL